MSSLGTTASLVTATMELSVVRLIRAAMASSDGAGTGTGGIGHPGDRFEPRPAVAPAPRFMPRPVVHPTPRFAPRPVIHPAPVYQNTAHPPVEAETPVARLTGPIEPVWKKLPVVQHPCPPTMIKTIQHPPDRVHKGSLIDFFI